MDCHHRSTQSDPPPSEGADVGSSADGRKLLCAGQCVNVEVDVDVDMDVEVGCQRG